MKLNAGLGWAIASACLATSVPAIAQAPRANGETLNIQHYAGTTGNMHAVIAKEKGFCTKYNFTCDTKAINSGILGLQALVGKSIDVALTGTEITAGTVNAGGDVVIVGMSLPVNVLFVAIRADVPQPNKDKGYPANMADLKGLKIGVPARGAGAEFYMNALLKEGGLQPTDVTYVAVGGPATAFTSMVTGKLVDAVILFEPVKTLCKATKACSLMVDLSENEGPASIKATNGAGVPFVMRREMVTDNPALVIAFQAAMLDAATWFKDPANFEELLKIYTPLISFGDMQGADALRRIWLKDMVGKYSKDLKVSRSGVKATIEFHVDAKTLEKPVAVEMLVWDKAP